MAMPARLSFLSYAVNGAGLGHVVRQVAIQRWLRRYCAFCGVRSEHWFLTTSEADTLLFHEGMASFKLPSKTVIEEAGVNKTAYIAMAKQWVWTTLATLRPDVLLVDTFPNGSFQELAGALDLVGNKVLVLRPVKEDYARRAAYAQLCALYDRVVVPGDADEAESMAELLGLPRERVTVTAPIVRTERSALRSRAAARAALGVPQDALVVLVSGGGGGDPGIDGLFDAVEEALARCAASRTAPEVHLVLAAGPLFRGRPRRGAQSGVHRTWLVEQDLATLLQGVDVAVCAAGFNSLHELALAGVATVFVPQDKVADDQRARAQALVNIGAAQLAEVSSVGRALAALIEDAPLRARLGAQAAQHMAENGARDAALAALGLVLPRSVLRQARAVLTDDVLARVVELGVSLESTIELAAALDGSSDRAALDLHAAFAVLAETGAPPDLAAKAAMALTRKSTGDVTRALIVVLRAVTGQWSALAPLLGALTAERVLSALELAEEIAALVEAAKSNGGDAFAAARALTEAAGGDEEGRRSNRAALRQARTRFRSAGVTADARPQEVP